MCRSIVDEIYYCSHQAWLSGPDLEPGPGPAGHHDSPAFLLRADLDWSFPGSEKIELLDNSLADISHLTFFCPILPKLRNLWLRLSEECDNDVSPVLCLSELGLRYLIIIKSPNMLKEWYSFSFGRHTLFFLDASSLVLVEKRNMWHWPGVAWSRWQLFCQCATLHLYNYCKRTFARVKQYVCNAI